jgi:hypothetical protein
MGEMLFFIYLFSDQYPAAESLLQRLVGQELQMLRVDMNPYDRRENLIEEYVYVCQNGSSEMPQETSRKRDFRPVIRKLLSSSYPRTLLEEWGDSVASAPIYN